MVLSTFNKELYEKDLKEAAEKEGRETGLREGLKEGREAERKELNALYQKLIACGRTEDLQRAIQDPEYLMKLQAEFSPVKRE